jgi:hypothetical protein
MDKLTTNKNLKAKLTLLKAQSKLTEFEKEYQQIKAMRKDLEE